jgi:hypothetical protein
MVADDVRMLLDNVEQRVAIYQAVLTLGRRQLELVEESGFPANAESVTKPLLERKKLIEQAEQLQAQAKAMESDLASEVGLAAFSVPGLQGKLAAGQYQELARAYARLGWILSELVAVDSTLEESLREKIGMATRKLTTSVNSRQVADAYKSAPAPESKNERKK